MSNKTKNILFELVFIIVLPLLFVGLASCAPQPTEVICVTATPEGTLEAPTEVPLGDWYGWWERPQEEWPAEVDGAPVAYVQVRYDQGVHLLTCPDYNSNGCFLCTISENSIFGGTTVYNRTIAKPGKWLMVYPRGEQYAVPDIRIRPFCADGGGMVFHLMYEQIVDGKNLWIHPDRPLFIDSTDIVQYYWPGE